MPALQAAQVRGVQPPRLHREVETVRGRVSRWRSARCAEVGRRVPRLRLSHGGGAQIRRSEITRIAGNMDLSLYARVLDDALGDVRPVKDVIATRRRARTNRWSRPIAAGSRITPSISRMRASSSPRSCRWPSRSRAALSRAARPGTRAAVCPGGGRGRDLAERVHRKGRQGRQGAHGADPARQRVAGQQGARDGERGRTARTAQASSMSPRARRCRRSRRACANASWPSPMPPPPARSSRRPINSQRS